VLDERCDQVAEKRSAVGRVSAQVAVFREASGHYCGRCWCLLLRVVGGFSVAETKSEYQDDWFRIV
jgi:hypothetical protein